MKRRGCQDKDRERSSLMSRSPAVRRPLDRTLRGAHAHNAVTPPTPHPTIQSRKRVRPTKHGEGQVGAGETEEA